MDSDFESRVIDEHIKQAIESSREEDGIGPELIQQTILDVWAGTFIYSFFVDEDARLRQSVIDFVCQHRPGTNPRLGGHDSFGSYNFNIEIVFDDGTALFRFPIPRLVAFPDDKVKAEVATIRHVGRHTTIPVPHIYHWGTAAENPTRLKVPFIIMDHIPHAATIGQALEDPGFTIPSVPESQKRQHLYQKMADISLQLYSLTSDRIGSLGMLDNGEYAVTSAPLPHSLAYQVVNCSVPLSVLPPRDTVYASSAEYLAGEADLKIAELLFMDDRFIESAASCKDKFVGRCLLRELVRQRGNPGEEQTGTDGRREVFRLWGDDFRPENVLLDEDGEVVGVVDWEYTYFAPETYHVNSPWWLMLEFLEEYANKENDSADSSDNGQDESPEDAEAAGEDDEDGKERHAGLYEQWDELVRTYLLALGKEEEKLREKQGVQAAGRHLSSCSTQGPSTGGQQQPLSLSHRMRHRWDEDEKEHFLIASMTETFLVDKYYWEHVDELAWGANEVGGYEGRLEALNPPARLLMDWFVGRRSEEKQSADPKLLLGQVLQQMEGKSLVLENGQG